MHDLSQVKIEDLPLIIGTSLTFPGSETLKSGRLSEDFVVQGINFIKGSILGFDEEGMLWR